MPRHIRTISSNKRNKKPHEWIPSDFPFPVFEYSDGSMMYKTPDGVMHNLEEDIKKGVIKVKNN